MAHEGSGVCEAAGEEPQIGQEDQAVALAMVA
jgi:hypothetical protein